ncbi:MAG: hypothetical protein WA151_13310, partial [Desulfatirhabdiaceae bacterium]
MSDGIVQPVRTRNSPSLGPLAIMVATQTDLDAMTHGMDLNQSFTMRLYMSRLVVMGEKVA